LLSLLIGSGGSCAITVSVGLGICLGALSLTGGGFGFVLLAVGFFASANGIGCCGIGVCFTSG
jgi:hypothetical protein